jgi:hypothetical protein
MIYCGVLPPARSAGRASSGDRINSKDQETIVKNSRFYAVAIIGALFLMALAACAPASTAPKFPTGKFVSEKDKAVGWQFNADGTSAYYFASKDPVAEGTYAIDGNEYVETSNNVGSSDPACQANARYRWSYDGGKLTFAVLDDKCKDRIDAYTGGVFVAGQ